MRRPDVTGVRACGERLLVVVLMFLFFGTGYLWTGSGYTFSTDWVVLTELDRRIPLVPAFIIFYMLGYLFVLSPVLVLHRRRDFQAGVVVFVAMLSIAFLLFHFFPVYMPKQYPMGMDFLSRLTRYQQMTDFPVNNLPSLHVTLNLFAWLILFSHARRAALWCLPLVVCIALSTLLVKQHLVVDVLGGVLLAGLGGLAWRWLRERGGVHRAYGGALVLLVAVPLANVDGLLGALRVASRLLAQLTGV